MLRATGAWLAVEGGRDTEFPFASRLSGLGADRSEVGAANTIAGDSQ
jgi:hypothetical protein